MDDSLEDLWGENHRKGSSGVLKLKLNSLQVTILSCRDWWQQICNTDTIASKRERPSKTRIYMKTSKDALRITPQISSWLARRSTDYQRPQSHRTISYLCRIIYWNTQLICRCWIHERHVLLTILSHCDSPTNRCICRQLIRHKKKDRF